MPRRDDEPWPTRQHVAEHQRHREREQRAGIDLVACRHAERAAKISNGRAHHGLANSSGAFMRRRRRKCRSAARRSLERRVEPARVGLAGQPVTKRSARLIRGARTLSITREPVRVASALARPCSSVSRPTSARSPAAPPRARRRAPRRAQAFGRIGPSQSGSRGSCPCRRSRPARDHPPRPPADHQRLRRTGDVQRPQSGRRGLGSRPGGKTSSAQRHVVDTREAVERETVPRRAPGARFAIREEHSSASIACSSAIAGSAASAQARIRASARCIVSVAAREGEGASRSSASRHDSAAQAP